ncbi:RusA family crossover junction endodeoxyribonuclease [Acinetobacter sp. YH12073]|uniref:RusA family crossover junction endodeoxyribonuclease n=1 Tax=Acinetobacter sp. YH12073 TaxID=2601069 RepID=UPI00211DD292|nr:RusA family crossover junction endodeoxyribonuclease [Acinetobacter sp. YH12073]
MTVAELKRAYVHNKPKVKKRNPDPAPAVPAHLIKGYVNENVFEDDLLYCLIEITPPSVNNYWIKGKNKTNRLSLRAKHFNAVMKRFINPCGYGGKVQVDIQFAPPDRKIRDIDNIVKPIFDSLSKCGLILDDKQVEKLTVERLPIKKGGELTVYVRKI